MLNGWIVTRHADVAPALKDPRLRSGGRVEAMLGRLPPPVRAEVAALEAHLNGWIAFTDPPRHTRLRRLVAPAFSNRRVASMREAIGRSVNELIERMLDLDAPDVVRDLAFPLPASVIARMIGMPEDDHRLFGRWSTDIAAVISSAAVEPEAALRAQCSIEELSDYFGALLMDRRDHPQDDLLSAWLEPDSSGDRLTEHEIFSTFVQLFFAGHETTTGLIGNGLLALLRNPAQMDLLLGRPELIGSAVEEFLRYDTPIQRQARVASEDVVVGGQPVAAGDYLLLFIGSANRDPDHVDEPDTLDITRSDNRHLSFGVGMHFCVGAALARLEAEVALGSLLERIPGIALAGNVEWEHLLAIRKLRSLPVAC